MGSVARLAAVGSAFTLAACAVIAGLDDPAAVDGASGSSSSGSLQDTGNGSSSSGSSASDSASDGASSSGTPADAQPDVAQCPLQKLGDSCTQPSQCCSTKCNEERKCVNQCTGSGQFCDPFSTSGCCVGLWCSGQCAACRLAGQPAATDPIGGLPLSHSCCSRALQNGVGPNCQ